MRKAHLGSGTCQVLPQRGKGILRRKHRHTVFGKCCQHSAVFLRHRLHCGHEFLVLTLGVVHQGHRGLGHRGKPRDFSGVVHAQLDHCDAVVRAQTQQREWHPDFIVEVALGGHHVLGVFDTQNRSDHLCDRGFSVAPCDSQHRQAEFGTPSCGQLAQGFQAVGHHPTGQTTFKQ